MEWLAVRLASPLLFQNHYIGVIIIYSKMDNEEEFSTLVDETKLNCIVHVDLSKKFWERGHTGVAAINTDKKFHRGLALSPYLKKSLVKTTEFTDAKLYAICIWSVIKDDLNSIDLLVICDDAPFRNVKAYIEHFVGDKSLKMESISQHRQKLGRKVKSLADGIAKSYRKRALKPWRKGRKLNVVRVTYKEIIELLSKLNEVDEIIDKEKM